MSRTPVVVDLPSIAGRALAEPLSVSIDHRGRLAVASPEWRGAPTNRCTEHPPTAMQPCSCNSEHQRANQPPEPDDRRMTQRYQRMQSAPIARLHTTRQETARHGGELKHLM